LYSIILYGYDMLKIISDKAIDRRKYLFCIEEICNLSGHFGNDTERLEKELDAEIDEYR